MTALLLHPIGLDRRSWRWTDVPAATAIDLPGHGDAPARPLTSLDDAADAALASAPDGELDVFGLSLGGMVALRLALRHPSRVRSLVVACAGATAPRQVLLERAGETERHGMAGVIDATMRRWFSAQALKSDGPGVAYARDRLQSHDAAEFARYWRLMAEHDVTDRLGDVQAPTTVIAGSRDVSSPPEGLAAMAAAIPGARFAVVEGPHMLHLECPDAFGAQLRAHLGLVEAASRR